MRLTYEVNFNLKDCMESLNLEERGLVQRTVTEELLKMSSDYIPFDTGALADSGRIENDTDVVWSTPYAHYQWQGIVYEDPVLHCAGFKTEDGWRSRKGVQKVPTDRRLTYGNGNLRGDHWVDRMLSNGGKERIEEKAREAARK